jgi:hypothetical protein
MDKLKTATELWQGVIAMAEEKGVIDKQSNWTNTTWWNPFIQNARVKQIATKAKDFSRDSMEKMLKNPSENEEGLKSASWFFYNTITPMTKLYHMYADILTYRWWLIPEMGFYDGAVAKGWKKIYNDCADWIKRLKPKSIFREIVLDVIREGKVPYYLREDNDGKTIILQKLPVDYIKIIGKTELGWCYAFNFMYFLKPGTSVEQFPPEFAEWYKEFVCTVDCSNGKQVKVVGDIPQDVTIEMSRGKAYYYWKELPPSHAFMFGFDQTIPDILPPLMSMFLNSNDLVQYKMLEQELLSIPLRQILTATIPINQNNKTGSSVNDTAISPDLLTLYQAIIQASLPNSVAFVAAPFEKFDLFEFQHTMSRDSIVGEAVANFYKESGLGSLITTNDKPSIAAIKTQQWLESRFIDKIYNQFELFINSTISRYWKDSIKMVCHMAGNIFYDPDRLTSIEKDISTGNSNLYLEYLSFSEMDLTSVVASMDIVKESGAYEKMELPKTAQSEAAKVQAEIAEKALVTPTATAPKVPKEKNPNDTNPVGRPTKAIEDVTSDGSEETKDRGANTGEARGV